MMQSLNQSAFDQIMFFLANSAMKVGGHRYGAFLAAAATAAKCTIYSTYIEERQNLRATSHLYHIEPKRVRAIIREVQQTLEDGKSLKMLGSDNPDYLTQFPWLWLSKYPWKAGQSRMPDIRLQPSEIQTIERHLPDSLPDAQLIDDGQLLELVELLYLRSLDDEAIASALPFSEAIGDHIKRRLIHSNTIRKINTSLPFPLYALMRCSYAPSGTEERLYTLLNDTARFLQLMEQWVDDRPSVLRGVEECDIASEILPTALQELDELIRAWANKYHQEGGESVVLQLVAGKVESAQKREGSISILQPSPFD